MPHASGRAPVVRALGVEVAAGALAAVGVVAPLVDVEPVLACTHRCTHTHIHIRISVVEALAARVHISGTQSAVQVVHQHHTYSDTRLSLATVMIIIIMMMMVLLLLLLQLYIMMRVAIERASAMMYLRHGAREAQRTAQRTVHSEQRDQSVVVAVASVKTLSAMGSAAKIRYETRACVCVRHRAGLCESKQPQQQQQYYNHRWSCMEKTYPEQDPSPQP